MYLTLNSVILLGLSDLRPDVFRVGIEQNLPCCASSHKLVRTFRIFLHHAPAHALGGGSFFSTPQAHTVAELVSAVVHVVAALAASGIVGVGI